MVPLVSKPIGGKALYLVVRVPSIRLPLRIPIL